MILMRCLYCFVLVVYMCAGIGHTQPADRTGACDNGELAGGLETGDAPLCDGPASTAQGTIITVHERTDGLVVHRGGEVTYTAPGRAMPQRRAPRVTSVGNTRIIYAPDAFGPAERPPVNRAHQPEITGN